MRRDAKCQLLMVEHGFRSAHSRKHCLLLKNCLFKICLSKIKQSYEIAQRIFFWHYLRSLVVDFVDNIGLVKRHWFCLDQIFHLRLSFLVFWVDAPFLLLLQIQNSLHIVALKYSPPILLHFLDSFGNEDPNSRYERGMNHLTHLLYLLLSMLFFLKQG